MMQLLRNPKNVKLVSLFIAAVFVIGCFALSLTQSGFGKVASAAASESSIGVVNYQILVRQSPDVNKMQEEMKNFIEATQKDFNDKSASMANDAEKKRYFDQCQERIQAKEKELMEPILQNVENQIKKVADKKGLKVVVDKSAVVYGGVDITDEVAKAMQTGK